MNKEKVRISKWRWFYPTLEALVFFLIGAGLYSFSSVENLGVVFLSLSAIFIIHRVISTFENEKMFSDRMDELDDKLSIESKQIASIGQIVDLSQERLPEKIRSLNSSYLSVVEPKLRTYKEGILDEAIYSLSNLHHSQKTPILQEMEFYNWLKKEFEEASASTTFEIVSMDEDLEWTDTPEEKEFLEANIQAAKNGASITRIFVFNKDRMASARENYGIYQHRVNARSGLNGFVVDRSTIQKKAPSAFRQAGQGFIMVNRQRVIVDVFEDGEARGYVTFEPSEVAKYIDAYEQFSVPKVPLDFQSKALPSPSTPSADQEKEAK